MNIIPPPPQEIINNTSGDCSYSSCQEDPSTEVESHGGREESVHQEPGQGRPSHGRHTSQGRDEAESSGETLEGQHGKEDGVGAADHDAGEEGEGAEGEEEGPVGPAVGEEEGREGRESETEGGETERLEAREV